MGKWIAAAAIWKLLKSSWYKVTAVKLDPYLQIDAWTMSPYEHGEVFVTEDGFETDLDLGHYERFLDQNLTKESSITTGQIYKRIIEKERKWDYLWQTVQVIPHVTDEIKKRLIKIGKKFDITLVEIWWTIWDIEWPHFLEAVRQMRNDIWYDNTFFIHVAPILFLQYSWEMKTKPIQHSVRELTRIGIQPDMILCRSEHPITKKIREKISLFCNLPSTNIIEALDAESVYQVPELFKQHQVHKIIAKRLWLSQKKPNITTWNKRCNDFLHPKTSITIAMIAKYAQIKDSYFSVIEALKHAWAFFKTKVDIHYVQAEHFGKEHVMHKIMHDVDGILIPWWFGERGIEEKIKAAWYCREHAIPYLGLCLWLQVAIIDYVRNVCGLHHAQTVEIDPDAETPVISRMPWQSPDGIKWATMRLWTYTTKLLTWSKVSDLYTTYHKKALLPWNKIAERHRHRLEVNPDYYELLEEHWLTLSWRDSKSKLVEFIEIASHPFYVATQAHPEFRSRLEHPHPLFLWFVKACIERHKNN